MEHLASSTRTLYNASIVVHSITFAIKSLVRWDRAARYKIAQIIDVILLSINVFLMLESASVFAELQRFDHERGETLNPNKNFAMKGRSDSFLIIALAILLVLYVYL